jgi:hypothetical protein
VTRAALAPLGLLLAYGLAFAAVALGFSPLAVDDHPGQFFRLWHGLERGLAPWTWNADWWMGSPELQFSPPGFVYLGAALHYLSLTLLGPAAVYQALLWLIWLAPGVTAFLLLARLAPDPWLALPGAFVALTISGETMSGVEGGLRIGMIAARLGWALLPLLVLALVRWIESGGTRPGWATLVLAAIVLCHPGHAPAAVVLVALAALAGAGYKPYRLFQAGWLTLTAAALTAFWTLPLLAHLAESRALAWGDSPWDILRRLLASGPLPAALLLAAGAAAAIRRDRLSVVQTAFIPAMLLVIALDPSSRLPANRLVDSLVMGVVLAAGLGIGRGLGVLAGRWRIPPWAGAAAAVAVVVGLALPDARTLTLWPRPDDWPRLPEVEQRLRLTDLWGTLRAGPPGRVLFVRSGVPLEPLPAGTTEQPPWYRPHTHVTALAPLYAGRAIVNGTFTHPSAVAGLVYSGSPEPAPIRRLAEQLDGKELFGRGFDRLDGETLDRFTAFLGVSTVVMLEEDTGRLPALETHDRFAMIGARPWVVFHRPEPIVLPAQVGRDRWRIALQGTPGQWASARVAFSSLWSADGEGERLPVRRGRFGDLEVRIPKAPIVVDLVYRDGRWEQAGLVVSGFGLFAWGARWLTPARRRRHR